jgi:hypothetical protein
MKCKHLLITVITFTSLSASAQINKGSIFLGGHFGFSTGKVQNQKSSGLSISPAVGLAVKENLIVGVDFKLDQTKSSFPGFQDKMTNRYTGGGIFLRKYAHLGKGFYLFGQGRIGAARSIIDYDNDSSGQDAKGFAVNLGFFPGVAYSVTPRLHLEIGLPDLLNVSYSKQNYAATANHSAFKATSFSATTALNSTTSVLSIGVRFFLDKRRS